MKTIGEMLKIISCHSDQPEQFIKDREKSIKVDLIPALMEHENMSYDDAYNQIYNDIKGIYDMKILSMAHPTLSEAILDMKNNAKSAVQFDLEQEVFLAHLYEMKKSGDLDEFLDMFTRRQQNIKYLFEQ